MNGTDEGARKAGKREVFFASSEATDSRCWVCQLLCRWLHIQRMVKKGSASNRAHPLIANAVGYMFGCLGGYHEVGASLSRLPCAEEVHRAATSFR